MVLAEAWIALIGALGGGTLLKALDHFLSRSKIEQESQAAYRTELRSEIAALKEELDKVESEVDSWRKKYYEVQEEISRVKLERDNALRLVIEAGKDAKIADTARQKLQDSVDRLTSEQK